MSGPVSPATVITPIRKPGNHTSIGHIFYLVCAVMSIHLPPQSVIQEHKDDTDSESCLSSSSDEDEDQNDPRTWDNWVSDSQENKECYSLFEDKKFFSVQKTLEYDEQTHGFSLDRVSSTLGKVIPSSIQTRLIQLRSGQFFQPSTFTGVPGSSTTFANRSHSSQLDNVV